MNTKSIHEETEDQKGMGLPYGTGNADQANNNESNLNEIITYVEDTPFAVVNTEEGFIVVMGKYRMSEAHKEKWKAVKDAKKLTWMRILQVIGATIENYQPENNK